MLLVAAAAATAAAARIKKLDGRRKEGGAGTAEGTGRTGEGGAAGDRAASLGGGRSDE